MGERADHERRSLRDKFVYRQLGAHSGVPVILLNHGAGGERRSRQDGAEQDAMPPVMDGIGQRFVYILRRERDPARHYVGRSANVEERLRWHNGGPSGHTVRHRPWRVS